MDTLETLKSSLALMAPAITLILGGSVVMAASLVLKPGNARDVHGQRTGMAIASLAILVLAAMLELWRTMPSELGQGLFRFDQTALGSERLALLGGLILILMSWSTAPKANLGEYYGCLLIIIGAIPVVGASNDLVSLFLGLELISIPTYIMLGISKGDNAGSEATIKYFLLSAFASGFFLLGISYLYGFAGSTNLQVIQSSYASGGRLIAFAVVLVMCGLAFRITAVPFHFYAPDVFEGTSLTLAGIMSYLPKVAGFVALIRVLGTGLGAEAIAIVAPVLFVCSALTMLVGNFMASAQSSLRRLLAYSSVAHTGYLLLALTALLHQNAEPNVLFSYLAAYAAMTLGFFACLGEIEAAGGKTQLVGDLSGMFYRRPAASIGMTVCLISLIGLPLTAGFWAKFLVFMGTVAAGTKDPWSIAMAVLMAFNAVVAAGYYWRVLGKLFEKSDAYVPLRVFRPSLFMAYTICVVLTLVWFFVPAVM
ncbi:MAG: NADH-quinone oxidoreductase subunit N [Planctomycetota bacterium]|nr:NADH-quinone oxidoreductase subunit N [Planctomycetota bacterium]